MLSKFTFDIEKKTSLKIFLKVDIFKREGHGHKTMIEDKNNFTVVVDIGSMSLSSLQHGRTIMASMGF